MAEFTQKQDEKDSGIVPTKQSRGGIESNSTFPPDKTVKAEKQHSEADSSE